MIILFIAKQYRGSLTDYLICIHVDDMQGTTTVSLTKRKNKKKEEITNLNFSLHMYDVSSKNVFHKEKNRRVNRMIHKLE